MPGPEQRRFRPVEMFFLLLGVITSGGLIAFWFRAVPMLAENRGVELATLSGGAALMTNLPFQALCLVSVTALLAAGAATRVTRGDAKATNFMAGGCLLGFGVLVASVNALYEPLLQAPKAEAEVAADSSPPGK